MKKNARRGIRNRTFHIIIEQDEDNLFVAECPALKGCYTQGRTYAEVLRNIRDVIEMCVEDLRDRGEEIPDSPEIIAVKAIEISA